MTTPWRRFKRGVRHLRPWRRHSMVLAFAGSVYLLLGLLMVMLPMTDQRASSLVLVLRLAPIEFWGGVWILFGLLTLSSTRWPAESSETWGYTALAWLAGWWSAQFVVGVVLLGAPMTSLNGSLVYGLLGFLWWAISGLENPKENVDVEQISEPW